MGIILQSHRRDLAIIVTHSFPYQDQNESETSKLYIDQQTPFIISNKSRRKNMQAFTKLNGSYTNNGNFIWGAALSLAWKKLCKDIIMQPIKVKTHEDQALETTRNFNNTLCDFNMLSQESFYVRSGYGNATVELINQQMQKKFPKKTTEKLKPDLPSDGIISYAYFFKNLLFKNPFTPKEVNFKNKMVPGFVTKTYEQKQQVVVKQYVDKDNFMVELITKSEKDHLFIYKTSKEISPQEVIQKVCKTKTNSFLQNSQQFSMPKISIKHKRSVSQLINKFLANQKFTSFFFAEIYEVINFDLDQTGAKVENEGVIKLLRSAPMKKRQFKVDSPFWIVMRQKDNHPYFVANIVNVDP